jgi:membrane protein implicated in regulation of membrane protease activity
MYLNFFGRVLFVVSCGLIAGYLGIEIFGGNSPTPMVMFSIAAMISSAALWRYLDEHDNRQ